jgi:hypothetical protein
VKNDARDVFTRKRITLDTFTHKSAGDALRERNRTAQQEYRDRHGEDLKKARRVSSMLMQVLAGKKNVSLLAKTLLDLLPEEKAKVLSEKLLLGPAGLERDRAEHLDRIIRDLRGSKAEK